VALRLSGDACGAWATRLPRALCVCPEAACRSCADCKLKADCSQTITCTIQYHSPRKSFALHSRNCEAQYMDEARRDRILPEAMKPADDVGSFTRSAGHDLIGQTFGQLVIVAFAGSGRGKRTANRVSSARLRPDVRGESC
jgi:hypothetical protein